MKCICSKITGKIKRVTNDKAAELVLIGTHTYSSKAAWKTAGRKV